MIGIAVFNHQNVQLVADLCILWRRLILHIVLQYLPHQVEILDGSQPRIIILPRVDINVDAHQRVDTG